MAAPEVSPGPARPDACKVQENQSESWCGQPGRAPLGGPAPPVPARAREPLFDRFCHNFLLPPTPPPPPPGRCHLPGGAFLAAAAARPRHDPGRLTQGVVAEQGVRVVVHRPREGVQRAPEAAGSVGGGQRGSGVVREGGVDRRGLVHRGPVGGHEAGEGGVGGRQRGGGGGRSGPAAQDVLDVERRRVRRLQQRRGRVQRHPHGTRRRRPGVWVLHGSAALRPLGELAARAAALHLSALRAPGDRLCRPRGGAALSGPFLPPGPAANGAEPREPPPAPTLGPPPPAELPAPRDALACSLLGPCAPVPGWPPPSLGVPGTLVREALEGSPGPCLSWEDTRKIAPGTHGPKWSQPLSGGNSAETRGALVQDRAQGDRGLSQARSSWTRAWQA